MEGMNFTQTENNNNPVFDTIAQATAAPPEDLPRRVRRKEYTKEEKERYMETLGTSGRKGIKMPRINLALTPENMKYIKCMGQVTGDGMTAFINLIIHQHMEEHEALYEKARDFQRALEEG